jgi:DNA mismatch endonuclease (patch repair protein)
MAARSPRPGVSTDVFTEAERSAVMRRVKGRDTGPELRLRKLLTRMGLRYRLHRKDLPGSPDIAMMGRKTAIFMHGCFWHGHDCKRGARQPKANADYWIAKIRRNRARDAANIARLEDMGWRAMAIWECELKDEAGVEARLQTLLNPSSASCARETELCRAPCNATE